MWAGGFFFYVLCFFCRSLSYKTVKKQNKTFIYRQVGRKGNNLKYLNIVKVFTQDYLAHGWISIFQLQSSKKIGTEISIYKLLVLRFISCP